MRTIEELRGSRSTDRRDERRERHPLGRATTRATGDATTATRLRARKAVGEGMTRAAARERDFTQLTLGPYSRPISRDTRTSRMSADPDGEERHRIGAARPSTR